MPFNSENIEKLKKKFLIKYPPFGAIISNIEYKLVDKDICKTAMMDGKNIYFNAEFMSQLSDTQQLFIFSHEILHKALKHIERSVGRDYEVWNIATDAIINQRLKKDGLPLIDGCVNIKDALNYSADELYEKLLIDKKNGKNFDSLILGKNQKGDKENKEQSESRKIIWRDDHSMWGKSAESSKEGKKSTSSSTNEKEVFKKVDNQKEKNIEKIMQNLNDSRRGINGRGNLTEISNIGIPNKPVTSWKKLLSMYLEKEDEMWGHRFSTKESGYVARLEDVEVDDKGKVEIILDTSSSVSIDLLKNFLRQIKLILKDDYQIQLGTFSDIFHGFVNIKRLSDIDSIKLNVGGGTNFDIASKSFSKNKDIKKVCFTDGNDCGDAGITEKRKDIIWICYNNPHFKPDFGKVIYATEKDINKGISEMDR